MMAIMEQFSDTARGVMNDYATNVAAVVLMLVIVAAIGWAVEFLECRFESGLRRLAGIPSAAAQLVDTGRPDLNRAAAEPFRRGRMADFPASGQIVSPRRAYTLAGQFAKGDLCDVHLAVSDDVEWLLKIPRRPDRGNLMLKEHRVLQQLHERSDDSPYRFYFPHPEETFRIDRRQVNVYRQRDGLFTAEQIRRQFTDGLDGRHLAWMLNRTLEAIGFAHNNGWIHGAVLPPHLLFDVADHGLQLVDWIHSETIGSRLRIASMRYRDWYPPECHQRRPSTPSVDIYLAARSMIYLAGGDPISNRFPRHIPQEIQRFLQSCVLDSVRMRPQDAWELHEEWTDVLEGVYGPPKFHPLEMKGESHGYHSLV